MSRLTHNFFDMAFGGIVSDHCYNFFRNRQSNIHTHFTPLWESCVLMRKWAVFEFLSLWLSIFMRITEGNTMNDFQERPSEDVYCWYCYPHSLPVWSFGRNFKHNTSYELVLFEQILTFDFLPTTCNTVCMYDGCAWVHRQMSQMCLMRAKDGNIWTFYQGEATMRVWCVCVWLTQGQRKCALAGPFHTDKALFHKVADLWS